VQKDQCLGVHSGIFILRIPREIVRGGEKEGERAKEKMFAGNVFQVHLIKFYPALRAFSCAFAFFEYSLFSSFHHLLNFSFACPRATENAIMKLDDATRHSEMLSRLIARCRANRAFPELPNFRYSSTNLSTRSHSEIILDCRSNVVKLD